MLIYQEKVIKGFEILDELGFDLNECYLAGGAVRDHVLDRPIKDYDFFAPLKTLSFEHNFLITSSVNKIYNPKFLVYNSIEYPDIQFIFHQWKDINQVCRNFGFDICKIYMGVNGVIRESVYFKYSKNKEELSYRILPSITPQQIGIGLTDHYLRIHKKYPWPLKVIHYV